MKWTAEQVVERLRRRWHIGADLVQEEWAMFEQVALRRGRNERTIDVLLVRCWSGAPLRHQRIAIEVKVTRADFRQETPRKREPAEHSAHRCYYAAPVGIIPVEELPEGWGLIEVDEEGGSTIVRKAAALTPGCNLDHLAAVLARKGSRAVEHLRSGADAAAEVPRLRAEVERLSAALYRRDQAARRERQRATAARRELLRLSGQECADCGEPVTFARGGRYEGSWHHVDNAIEETCREQRREANRRGREQAAGAYYLSGYPGPVEPRALREQHDRDAAEDEAEARRDASAEGA